MMDGSLHMLNSRKLSLPKEFMNTPPLPAWAVTKWVEKDDCCEEKNLEQSWSCQLFQLCCFRNLYGMSPRAIITRVSKTASIYKAL